MQIFYVKFICKYNATMLGSITIHYKSIYRENLTHKVSEIVDKNVEKVGFKQQKCRKIWTGCHGAWQSAQHDVLKLNFWILDPWQTTLTFVRHGLHVLALSFPLGAMTASSSWSMTVVMVPVTACIFAYFLHSLYFFFVFSADHFVPAMQSKKVSLLK